MASPTIVFHEKRWLVRAENGMELTVDFVQPPRAKKADIRVAIWWPNDWIGQYCPDVASEVGQRLKDGENKEEIGRYLIQILENAMASTVDA